MKERRRANAIDYVVVVVSDAAFLFATFPDQTMLVRVTLYRKVQYHAIAP